MKTLKLKLQDENSKLQRETRRIINRHTDSYIDKEEWIRDLLSNSCVSGMVGELVYYRDTIKFYKKHKSEIKELLNESMQSCGVNCPDEIFGEKWDSEDFDASETQNQNLLAWFAFEETARNLAYHNNIDV